MNTSHEKNTRKKFILLTAAAFCSATFLNFFSREKKKKETVKMLAEDGTLVEIDKDLMYASIKKISNEELQNWVKK